MGIANLDYSENLDLLAIVRVLQRQTINIKDEVAGGRISISPFDKDVRSPLMFLLSEFLWPRVATREPPVVSSVHVATLHRRSHPKSLVAGWLSCHPRFCPGHSITAILKSPLPKSISDDYHRHVTFMINSSRRRVFFPVREGQYVPSAVSLPRTDRSGTAHQRNQSGRRSWWTRWPQRSCPREFAASPSSLK